MKVARAAPRLNASIPTLPVPAKRSRKRASSTRVERMSKSAVLTRSMMGRVPVVLGAFNLRPLASPVTTRMDARLSLSVYDDQYRSYLVLEVVFFGPGDQRLYMVLFQLFVGIDVPQALNKLLELRVADLRVQQVV